MNYILDGENTVECDDITEWGRWFETADRHVAETIIGDVRISTVFLGIDHNFWGGLPILFETMVFGGKHDGYQERYYSYKDAKEGHNKIVEMVKNTDKLMRFFIHD